MDMTKPFEGQLTGPYLLIRLAHGGSLRGRHAAGAACGRLRQQLGETAIRTHGGVIGRFALAADHLKRGS